MADGTRRYPVIGYVSEPTDEWSLSAVLVRSVRTPAGPRQKVVGYLGSIEEAYRDQVGHRSGFWGSAEAALDEAGVAGEERARIAAALEAVVPRPTAEEEAAAQRARWAAAEEERASLAGKINERHRREPSLSYILRGLRARQYLEAVAAEHPDGPEAAFLRGLREREGEPAPAPQAPEGPPQPAEPPGRRRRQSQ
jgi:hypothetical protein